MAPKEHEMKDILESAFVKYLRCLSKKERAAHLIECFTTGGSLAYELAKCFDEYDPFKLAELLEAQNGDK